MPFPARVSRAALALLAASPLVAGGCETDAVGIQECREIERARCEAARHCDLGIDDDDEAATCERFARDGCLRGLTAPEAPRSDQLEACVTAIRLAGSCASRDSKTTAEACRISVTGEATTAVCTIVQAPEQATACAFLLTREEPAPEPEAPEDAGAD